MQEPGLELGLPDPQARALSILPQGGGRRQARVQVWLNDAAPWCVCGTRAADRCPCAFAWR